MGRGPLRYYRSSHPLSPETMLYRLSLACLLLALGLAACSPAPDARVGSLSGAALMARIDAANAPLILDVRTPQEYAAGHIAGAVNIPHTEIEARIAELGDNRDREIVVHCKSGRRASAAEQLLIDAGYTRVLHLEGDLQDWEAQGRPVVTEPAS